MLCEQIITATLVLIVLAIIMFVVCCACDSRRSRFGGPCPDDETKMSCSGVTCKGAACWQNPCCSCVASCNPGEVPDGYDCTEFTADMPKCIPKA